MYRYSNSKFSNLLTVLGGVRVGTLHDFRKSEHKKGIADPQEGKKTVVHRIGSETIVLGDRSSKTAMAVEAFNVIRGSGVVAFENVIFSQSFDSPDFFVLCSSYEKSASVMSQFEGADTCVHIHDPIGFYRELTTLLNLITPVVFLGVHKVIYRDRIEPWNGTSWGADPTLIKEHEFSPQKEVRAIWAPKFRQPIKPQVIGSVKLGRTCRQIPI
ncbi:hypothetical protein [Aeromonas caviae]|uniref:hypothetical protein n=1 Tax=Aeromonas caviae TaxID=648 RepID=UPI001FB94F03|nr:hypothetical protein [Aeromonas caviae]BDO06923.1 hypothetical protein KAM643c_04960 [Aeromonas caviae]GKR76754.1 hypothetical protein KAM481_02240 [Aeromonas caviae]